MIEIRFLILFIYTFLSFFLIREDAVESNVGKLLQRRGAEMLGARYKDPISSFLDFQEFSVSNPEVFFNFF